MASVTTAPQSYRLSSPLVGAGYQQSHGFGISPSIPGFNASSFQYLSNGYVMPYNYTPSSNSCPVPVDYYTTTPPMDDHLASQAPSKSDSKEETVQSEQDQRHSQVLTSTEKRDPPINPPSPQCNQKSLVPKSFASKPRVTTTLWEDEGTLCFQVEARGVCVARREDNNMVNGTKLLNVAGMTRGRRDGILKTERVRHVVKIGAMHLKGVWIPYERALAFANKEKITDLLYPLFVNDIKKLLYHPPVELARSVSVSSRHSSDEDDCKTCDSLTGQSVKSTSSTSPHIAHPPTEGDLYNNSNNKVEQMKHQDSTSRSMSLSAPNSTQPSSHSESFEYSKSEHERGSISSTSTSLTMPITQQSQTAYYSPSYTLGTNNSTNSAGMNSGNWALQFPPVPVQSHQPIPRSASTPMISFQNTFLSQPGYPHTSAPTLSINQHDSTESVLNARFESTGSKGRSDEKPPLKRMKSDHL